MCNEFAHMCLAHQCKCLWNQAWRTGSACQRERRPRSVPADRACHVLHCCQQSPDTLRQIDVRRFGSGVVPTAHCSCMCRYACEAAAGQVAGQQGAYAARMINRRYKMGRGGLHVRFPLAHITFHPCTLWCWVVICNAVYALNYDFGQGSRVLHKAGSEFCLLSSETSSQ